MRILLVEDNKETAKCIEVMLRAENFVVDATDRGEDAIEIGKLYDHDLIVLDLNLPDIGGDEVLRRLRSANVVTPVLILSSSGDLDHKVKSLGFGADDFLSKPFERRELVARIHAIVRRAKGHAQPTIRIGKLVVDLGARTAAVDGTQLRLTGKEYEVLELLSLRKGNTVAKETFMDNLYGGDNEPVPKIIDIYICRLRKKLMAATGGEDYIETSYGQGYALRPPVLHPAAAPEPVQV
jgi:two-component system cell cycle response regulator CtrA